MPIFRLQQLFLSQNKFLNYLNRFHLLTVPMPQCNCWRSRFLKLFKPIYLKHSAKIKVKQGNLRIGRCFSYLAIGSDRFRIVLNGMSAIRVIWKICGLNHHRPAPAIRARDRAMLSRKVSSGIVMVILRLPSSSFSMQSLSLVLNAPVS
jgi:hypothetical protein